MTDPTALSISSAETEIRQAWQRLVAASYRLRQARTAYLDDLGARYAARLRDLEAHFAAARAAAAEEEAGALAAAHQAYEQAAAAAVASVDVLWQPHSTLAPLLAPWEAPFWAEYAPPSEDAPIPEGLRIGELCVEAGIDVEGDVRAKNFSPLPPPSPLRLPLLVPFLRRGSLFLRGPDPDALRRLLQALLLRLVVTLPPGRLRLSLADPLGMGVHLSAFLRLPDAVRGDKVCSRPEEIARQVQALEAHLESVLQTRLQNLYPDVEAYNAQAGELAVPYHVFALTDFPAGCDERTAAGLVRLARNGPRAGVYLLMTWNDAQKMPRDFDPQALLDAGTVITLDEEGHLDPSSLPDAADILSPEARPPFIPDAPPDPGTINRLLETVGAALQRQSTALPFRRVAIPPAERWQASSLDGLRVPIGTAATGEVHAFAIGQEGSVVHHGLIGGATGSGKSNLLHVLITQLALRYAPEELEMYLVDFKEGVGFQDYLRLPHARAVGLESEREFGRSVLRYLQGEMEERGRRFKQVGADSLVAYRLRTGERLPRILLVMDEFQVLFAEDDPLGRECGRILEDLVRRGRSFGIHILLSSQTPSAAGMYSGRLFNQMALRIAFRSQPNEAQAILGEGNTAADRLERVGEAIYNDEMGHKEKNVLVRVAFLPPEERRQMLDEIGRLAAARPYQPPVTFEGRAPARLESNAEWLEHARTPKASPRRRPPAVRLWLGEPVEIKSPTAAVVERYPRSNLLIVGGNDEQAYGLLLAALLSLAAQYTPEEVRLAVTDFARPETVGYGLWSGLHLPHPLEVIGPRQAGALLTQLLALLDQRLSGEAAPTEVFLLIPGLQRWRELRSTDAYGTQQSEPAKGLTRLAEEGPEVGIHLLAWADSLATAERVFKRGGLAHFDLRVALQMNDKESTDLLGSPSAARLGENRALLRHEDWEAGRMEKFKPYALPDEETLARLVALLRGESPL
jgi:S-DNA-T family DNA segregation ATPase FtsK/SpoIIIE